MRVRDALRKALVAVSAALMLVVLLPASAMAQRAQGKIVRVGLFDDTYHKVNDTGELYGYGCEYLQKIASYTGWTIEYVEADWYTCFNKLASGEIDILNGSERTTATRRY